MIVWTFALCVLAGVVAGELAAVAAGKTVRR